MNKNYSSGFTLIELLVVIAIIGVLSSVVLASLNTARTKGNDAAIMSNLSTIQTQAEVFYGGTGANSYTGVCSDSIVVKAMSSATVANGGTATVCNSAAQAYAVSSKLPSYTTTTYYCIDSTGKVGTTTTALAALTACP